MKAKSPQQGESTTKKSLFGRKGRKPKQQEPGGTDGASWGIVHTAVGGEPNSLGSAPGVAEREDETGGGLVQGENSDAIPESPEPDPADTDASLVRLPPTISADEFVHAGVAAHDRPPLPFNHPGDLKRVSTKKRRLHTGVKLTGSISPKTSPEENELIAAAAAGYNQSRSAFIVDSVMTYALEYAQHGDNAIRPRPGLAAAQELSEMTGRFMREVHRVGVNLNQVARKTNMGVLPEHASVVLDEVEACAHTVRIAVGEILKDFRHGA